MDAYGFGYACGYWHVCLFKNMIKWATLYVCLSIIVQYVWLSRNMHLNTSIK